MRKSGYFFISAFTPSLSLAACCVHVLRVDREHGLLACEEVGPRVAALVAGGCLGHAAVPGGDAGVLVAGAFGAERRQRGLELGRFFGRDRGLGQRGDEQACDERSEQVFAMHGETPVQKVRETLKAT
jgi:hypothetical protein